jgi:hypothetical protein
LEYYDLQRLALTFRFPILQSAQDAPDDPSTIVAPDRTWALSRAFRRNLSDNGPGCSAPPETMEERDREELTLSKAAENLNNHTMPAFTLNTTVAESGGRFLLSNYMVPSAAIPPSQAKPNTEFLPAESFLQAYANESCANCANGPDGEKFYVDLPLSTAARMSATFPVVSSATRIPPKYAKAASHFLDGGYFDNDGTGSVIEFLYSVMDQRKADPTAKPLRVLLVEIRDGGDLDPNFNPDDLQDQIGRGKPNAPWWTLNQLLGPLDGLWNAGHESVTLRNRRELCVLETAYQGKLFIHHVVFAIPEQPYGKDKLRPSPLSWKLTAGELSYISAVANGDPLAATDKRIKDAMDATDNAVEDGMGWVATAETKTSKELPSDVCSVSNAPSK